MQEVEAICERVVVINRGHIVANDRLENLLRHKDHQSSVIVEFETTIDTGDMERLPGVARLADLGDNRYRVQLHPGVDIRPELFRYAADRRLSLIGLKQEENSLENIFRELTTGKGNLQGD